MSIQSQEQEESTVNLEVTVKDKNGSWTEIWKDYTPDITQQEAEHICRRVIKDFNTTERERYENIPSEREFVGVKIVESHGKE